MYFFSLANYKFEHFIYYRLDNIYKNYERKIKKNG